MNKRITKSKHDTKDHILVRFLIHDKNLLKFHKQQMHNTFRKKNPSSSGRNDTAASLVEIAKEGTGKENDRWEQRANRKAGSISQSENETAKVATLHTVFI